MFEDLKKKSENVLKFSYFEYVFRGNIVPVSLTFAYNKPFWKWTLSTKLFFCSELNTYHLNPSFCHFASGGIFDEILRLIYSDDTANLAAIIPLVVQYVYEGWGMLNVAV